MEAARSKFADTSARKVVAAARASGERIDSPRSRQEQDRLLRQRGILPPNPGGGNRRPWQQLQQQHEPQQDQDGACVRGCVHAAGARVALPLCLVVARAAFAAACFLPPLSLSRLLVVLVLVVGAALSSSLSSSSPLSLLLSSSSAASLSSCLIIALAVLPFVCRSRRRRRNTVAVVGQDRRRAVGIIRRGR